LERLVKKYKIDFPGLRAAVRTAGALMLGNAFVAPLRLGSRDWLALVSLAVLGLLAIIASCIEKRN
jgi:hypothetical protein